MSSGAPRRRLRVGACLSLSGRFARFGTQAAHALRVWADWDGSVELAIEDDRSDPRTVEAALPGLGSACDIMLGPYSTMLMRTAGRIAADAGLLVWNHGGSGDDVQAAHPGHIVSVLTPTSRYAEPFLFHLARASHRGVLWIAHGKGAFGRQVADGAEAIAHQLHINTARMGPGDTLPAIDHPRSWHLFSAGQFETDVQLINQALGLAHPPQLLCCVAAGVREFATVVDSPQGVFGIGQWARHRQREVMTGPTEDEFIHGYQDRTGAFPDYPAVQAAAAAMLAGLCVRKASSTQREAVWAAAIDLHTSTLFGDFGIDSATGVQTKHAMVLMRWNPTRQLQPA